MNGDGDREIEVDHDDDNDNEDVQYEQLQHADERGSLSKSASSLVLSLRH